MIYIFSIKGLKLFIGSKDVKFVPTKDSEAFFFHIQRIRREKNEGKDVTVYD